MGRGIDKLTTGFLKLLEMVHGTHVFLQRVLEIHIISLLCPVAMAHAAGGHGLSRDHVPSCFGAAVRF